MGLSVAGLADRLLLTNFRQRQHASTLALLSACFRNPRFGHSRTHLPRTTPPPTLDRERRREGGSALREPVHPFPFSSRLGVRASSFLPRPFLHQAPPPKGVMVRAVVLVVSLALSVLVCALPYATAFVLPPHSLASSSPEGDGRRTMSPAGEPASLEPLTRLAAAKKKSAGSGGGSGGSTSAAAPSPSKKKARGKDEVRVRGEGWASHSFLRIFVFYITF